MNAPLVENRHPVVAYRPVCCLHCGKRQAVDVPKGTPVSVRCEACRKSFTRVVV